jgi:hypothetical protein
MHARSDHEDRRPDVWIWIAILALWLSVSGRESTSSGRLQRSSHICVLERNPEAWSNTESRPTCCWNVRTDASWSGSKLLNTGEGLDGKFSSSGWMMLGTARHANGMICRPDGWHFGQMGVQTTSKEPSYLLCKLCGIFWNHFWIAEFLLKSIFTKKWFCQT